VYGRTGNDVARWCRSIRQDDVVCGEVAHWTRSRLTAPSGRKNDSEVCQCVLSKKDATGSCADLGVAVESDLHREEVSAGSQEPAGRGGGGAGWRILRMTSAVIPAVTSNATRAFIPRRYCPMCSDGHSPLGCRHAPEPSGCRSRAKSGETPALSRNCDPRQRGSQVASVSVGCGPSEERYRNRLPVSSRERRRS
jgi:hypothetical protein